MISILISTRNRAKQLPPALDSIVESFQHAQSCDDGEIVIVDNGSTDETHDVIENWAKQSPVKVVLLHEKRPGLSRARNLAIQKSSGDYLVFTDDDCYLSQTYITELKNYIENEKEPTLRSGSVKLGNPEDLPLTIKDVKKRKSWKRPEPLKEEAELLGRALIGCNMCASRDTINKIGHFDPILGAGAPCAASEDTDYFYRAYLQGVTLEMVPDLVLYHHHGRRHKSEAQKLYRNYALGNGALIVKYLFIYPRFSKHFLWDLKALYEHKVLKTQSKTHGQIPLEKRVIVQIKGMFLYHVSKVRSFFQKD